MPDRKPDTAKPGGEAGTSSEPRRHISMHESVPVWYDCCSCAAEPYWAELADVSTPEAAADTRDRSRHDAEDPGRPKR